MNPDLLVAGLTVAVPMWVEVVRGLPFEVRQERAERCMAEVAVDAHPVASPASDRVDALELHRRRFLGEPQVSEVATTEPRLQVGSPSPPL